MSTGGFDDERGNGKKAKAGDRVEDGTRHDDVARSGNGPGGSQAQSKNDKQGLAPGKRTRTSRLPPRRDADVANAPAPVQRTPDPAAEEARARQSLLTKAWLDTATRPDLYPPPEEDERAGDETARGPALQQAVDSSPVQRKPVGDGVPAPLPQPVLYFRRESEAPQPSRSVRRSIPGSVMDAHETLRAMLVYSYGWPAEQVKGPFDELWIAWDPPGSPGITREDLQRGAGIITVAVSPVLDAELERTAALIHTQRRGEPARRAGRTTTEGPQPAQPGAVTGSGAAHGAGAEERTSPKGEGPAQALAGGLVLPARLAWLAPGLPASISRADRAAWDEVIAALLALPDEDLANLRLLATYLTDDPKQLLAAIRLYSTLKGQYLATLEQSLAEAAADSAPLEPASTRTPDATGEAIDPATFQRWSRADKEQAARTRIEQLSRAQLAEMVQNPGQTLKEMVRSALRPDEALAEVAGDLHKASKAQGGWGKAARGTSATSKMTGVIAGMLAIFALVGMFTPGVNVMFLMQASFAMAMGAAALALVESDLYVRAAVEAGDVSAFEEEVRLGAEAQTRATVATAGMATALAGMLVARIPLPGRLQSIGHALDTARSAMAESAGKAWQSVRASTIDKLRQSTSGLIEALDGEAHRLVRTRAELDGMTAEQFYERIVRDDALREAVGIRKDVAEGLAELARTEHGAASAHKMFDELKQSYREAPELARKHVEQVIAEVDRTIKDLDAASSPAELDAALARAKSALSDTAVSSKMADTSAQHTAEKLKALVGKDDARMQRSGDRRAARDLAESEAPGRSRTATLDSAKSGTVDLDAWRARLQQTGVKGDLDPVIARAQGTGPDAIAARGELRSFERAAQRGYMVEPIEPPKGKSAPQGRLSPEAKLHRNGEELRLEVKTATEPPNADTWRSHFDKANRQIKMSSHDGEIHFDWTVVDLRKSADFMAVADIERLIARKMTDSRGGRIRYTEIRWRDPDTGTLRVTYRERRADGKVGPVITEDL